MSKYIYRSKHNLICNTCGKSFKGHKSKKYCSLECTPSAVKPPPRGMCREFGLSRGTVGAMSELVVCVDLMKKGWEVFRAMSPNSRCDLLATKNGELLKLEVRTGMYLKNMRVSYPTAFTEGKSVVVVTLRDYKVHYMGFTP